MTHNHSLNPPLPGLIPNALREVGAVVEQEAIACETYRIRLRCPKIARRILPGQFVMLRLPDETDPLLGRPFALYDTYETDGESVGIDIGYIVIGKLTRLMARWKPGQDVELWGPLGNGFPLPEAGHLLMMAGGIGQTPFLAVAREALRQQQYGSPPRQPARLPNRLSLCYGVRSADYLAGLDDFDLPGLSVAVSTDDGTAGHHGRVTDLLRQALETDRPDSVYCCGPEPMMKAAADICAAAQLPCWLSLETPMACGFGACFSCVVRVRLDDENWDYRRTCVEGPVFPAETLLLD